MLVLWSAMIACADGSPPPCRGWDPPRSTGTLASTELDEASGLVASRLAPGRLWSHNDQGGAPRLYALDTTGGSIGSRSLVVSGVSVTAQDWEDIAVGVDPDGLAALYVGDIGDNDARRDRLTAWRVIEPQDASGEADDQVIEAAPLHLWLPDGPVDAEGLAVDPRSNQLLLFTKEHGRSRVYVADALADAGSEQPAELLASLDIVGADGDDRVRGADISPDGSRLLLRTEQGVQVLERGADDGLDALLAADACSAPAPEEPAGESIAAMVDGFMTTSEGAGAHLWQVLAP